MDAFKNMKEHIEIETLKALTYPQINELLNKQNDRIKELESAIETTITGMEWNAEHHPTVFGKADREYLVNLKGLIDKKKS